MEKNSYIHYSFEEYSAINRELFENSIKVANNEQKSKRKSS